jgi:glycosyltransferase involved in cell wall biosynthesis
MRVLVVHNYYKGSGGEDEVYRQEKELLVRNGNDVETIEFYNSDFESASLKTIFNIFQVVFSWQSYKEIRRKIVSFKPELIHVHNFFYVASPSIFYAAKRFKIPIVLTVHNYRLICMNGKLLRNNQVCTLCVKKRYPIFEARFACFQASFTKTLLLSLMTGIHKQLRTWNNKVDLYICLTDFSRKLLIDSSLSLSGKQVKVKTNFVEDYGFSSKINRDEFFLFVGRISIEKGINVIKKLIQETDILIEVIGTGPMKNDFMELQARNSNFKYWNEQPKEKVIERMKKCKALIFPSIWYEGMPMTIIESFSTGTPVIISNIDNLKEIVIENVNGLHFQTNSIKSLINAIKTFESLPKNIYNSTRETYLNSYTPQDNYKKLLTIYSELKVKTDVIY